MKIARKLTRISLRLSWKWLAVAGLLITGACLSGCLSRPPLKRESFNFAVPALKTASSTESERVLSVRAIDISSAYQGRLFVYRTGESAYERDPYAEFFVSPAE